ncbi:MAG: trimethylamine methyltransferase family protein [Victivallales bacterium]|nr:trimethylamine methyltransferase family protein [Victivallales bacterium]
MSNVFLSQQDSQLIHEKALQVLEKTGVKMSHKEGRKILTKAGAKEDGDYILIPRELTEEMLKLTIPEIQMHDRNGNQAMLLAPDYRANFGSGSDAIYQIDMETNERRFTTLNDIKNNLRLLDKLDHFDFVMSTGVPQPSEVPKDEVYKTVFETMAKNTTKPIIATLTCLNDIMEIHKSALELAGEWIKEKPYFLAYLEPISPLIMDDAGTDRIMFCAKNNIPFCYAAGANCGSGAPVNIEGGIIQGTAEFLGGYVLAKLVNPKAMTIYGANTSSVNPKTMLVRYGCPEWFKTTAVYADMGRFYNMPVWGTGVSTDALKLGPLAAWEAQQGVQTAIDSKCAIVHDVAYFDHGNTYDPRMLLLANEIIKREKFLKKPLNLDESFINETIRVINEVARTDGYLYPIHPHTAEHLRKSTYIPAKYLKPDKDYLVSLKEEVERLWS